MLIREQTPNWSTLLSKISLNTVASQYGFLLPKNSKSGTALALSVHLIFRVFRAIQGLALTMAGWPKVTLWAQSSFCSLAPVATFIPVLWAFTNTIFQFHKLATKCRNSVAVEPVLKNISLCTCYYRGPSGAHALEEEYDPASSSCISWGWSLHIWSQHEFIKFLAVVLNSFALFTVQPSFEFLWDSLFLLYNSKQLLISIWLLCILKAENRNFSAPSSVVMKPWIIIKNQNWVLHDYLLND